MHPAFSVIFFTALSGAGYGAWFWAMIFFTGGDHPKLSSSAAYLVVLALGAAFVSIGLGSSVLHLGKPLRAWRAFSQWRTSWLSREGVLAIATFIPFAFCLGIAAGFLPIDGTSARLMAILLAIGSLATVLCTAMIYASLRTIPAWSHRLVPTVYLVFALHTGGLIFLGVFAGEFLFGNDIAGLAVLLTSMLAWRLKRRYWRDIDRAELPASRASALGLPADRVATVFERPHTEANYLTTEMGFVLARKHAAKLRLIAVVLFAIVPMLCALPLFFFPITDTRLLFGIAALSALLGTFVERWLFFAQARHVVMVYYQDAV